MYVVVFSIFFSSSTTFISVPFFFFPGRKTAGHPGAARSLEQISGHSGHRGGQAAPAWHSCPDDPEADGHHPAIRVTMPITGVGGGYQVVPPGSREELPEGPGFLPQEPCKYTLVLGEQRGPRSPGSLHAHLLGTWGSCKR